MNLKKVLGVLKTFTVILSIITCSGWIGFSINRSFLRGPQKSMYTMKKVDGQSRFVQIDDSPSLPSPTTGRVELGELKSLIASGAVILVDGRAVKDFEAGHIPGAYNLPAMEIEARYAAFSAQVPQDQSLVVYCGGHDCSLAQILAGAFVKKGYKHIKVYYGGFSEWFLGGNAVEKGEPPNATRK